MNSEQLTLLDLPADWEDAWRDMPAFVNQDLEAFRSITVNFHTMEDLEAFAERIGQRITSGQKSLWFPPETIASRSNRLSSLASAPLPHYPLYIISKGRWESRLTSKCLERIGVPYRIVIEPQEYASYAAVINPARILILPFSNLGQGSIPARNWVWEHSINEEYERHWILDDNISGFIRFHENKRVPIQTAEGLVAMEEFVDRYENVALAGPNYRFLGGGSRSAKIPAFIPNTRVYSCILIKNDLPYRWRGRYNEDTDLSLRALKDGYCTILFNAFKIDKIATMTMKGGNTDNLYQGDGRLKMAESLRDQHPDIVTITQKWGRFQHHVDYTGFKRNQLRLKAGVSAALSEPKT